MKYICSSPLFTDMSVSTDKELILFTPEYLATGHFERFTLININKREHALSYFLFFHTFSATELEMVTDSYLVKTNERHVGFT